MAELDLRAPSVIFDVGLDASQLTRSPFIHSFYGVKACLHGNMI